MLTKQVTSIIMEDYRQRCQAILKYSGECKSLKKPLALPRFLQGTSNPKTKTKLPPKTADQIQTEQAPQTNFRVYASRLRMPLWKSSVHFLQVLLLICHVTLQWPQRVLEFFSLLIVFLSQQPVSGQLHQLLVSCRE